MLWSVFGATYELIKCYKNEDENSDFDTSSDMYQRNVVRIIPPKQSDEVEPKTKYRECLIYASLVTLGLFLQPIYIMLKCLQIILECSKQYGCWYY